MFKHLKFSKQKWIGELREKFENDILHGNINMAPLNDGLLQVSGKFQNGNMHNICQ